MIVDIDLTNRDGVVFVHKKEFRTFSYTGIEIENYIERLLGFFAKNKIKKGDKILVLGQNSPQLATVFLAAIRAGIILIPLDIHSSSSFIKKIKKQTKPKLFFTSIPISSLGIKTIFVDDLFDALEENHHYEKNEMKENDIIEIVYTSGTTGDPKGVVLTHKNIASNIAELEKLYNFKSERFLSLLPLSHVFEQTVGFFLPLKNNATIVYLERLNAREMAKAFREQKITISLVVPRVLRLFKEKIEEKIKEKRKQDELAFFREIATNSFFKKIFFRKIHKQFPYLKFFVVGGAFLDHETEEFFEDIGIKVYQGYGLTETSPVISTNYPDKKMLCSVGKVLPNIKLKIVNEEIWVKGDSVFSGYYKRPEKNKEAFSSGWFKTGDLGFLADGFLFIKGRKKEVIVTEAGINVYPDDIESVLNNHPAIKESCVVEFPTGKIHATILLKRGAKLESIVDETNKKLSSPQKITSFSIWPFEDFPRTPTMKIKRYEVQEFVAKKEMPEVQSYEDTLYSIISRFTDKKITENSRLTSLGMTSLDRVQLVSDIEDAFNVEIDESKIISSTTVKDMQALIKEHGRKGQLKQRKWVLSWPARILRFILQWTIFIPFLKLHCKIIKVEGKENLENIQAPVIFASNHESHLDSAIIIAALPLRFSIKTAIATLSEFFERKNFIIRFILYNLATIAGNSYMFSQERYIRSSMRYTGELVDKGWNILIFPEGERTTTGKMSKLKPGIGLLVNEMKIPVVPIKIDGAFEIWPRFKKWPSYGKVTVKFGKPLFFKKESPQEITRIIERELRKL